MKKTLTKSLALLLAVLMLMTAMPMGVFAEETCTHWLTLETHAKKDATATEDGNISYAFCTHCQKYFPLGSNGPDFTKVLNDEDVILHFFPDNQHYDLGVPGNDGKKKEDATCKSGNIYYKKCANCDVYSETLTYEDDDRAPCTPADEWTVPAGADCTEKGFTKKLLCTVCKKSVREVQVPKGNHVEENKDIIEATCQKVGHKGGVYCNNCCKYLQGGEIIEKKAHEITTLEKRVEPTCTEPGSEEMKDCKMCHGKETLVGGRYINNQPVANVIPKLGHNLIDVTKRDKTCLEDGYTSDGRICSRCKYVFTPKGADIIDPAPGSHNPIIHHAYRAATTSREGNEEYWECSRENCKAVFVQKKDAAGIGEVNPSTGKPILEETTIDKVTIPIVDHTHKLYKDTTLSKDKKCLTDGRLVMRCDICNQIIQDEVLKATGHDWKWVEGKKATCYSTGTTFEQCSVCKEKRGELQITEKLPHTWKLKEPADCTKGGKAVYECEVCHETEERDVVPQGNHVDADDNGVCDVCETKFCSCICHNQAWYGKILLFFVQVWWQFLGIRQTCACGKVHYVKAATQDVPSVT